MLSAKKEDKRLAALLAVTDLSTQGSLGRLADSIHNLRERLQNVSLEEITDADDKLKTSLARLSAVQNALTRLIEMKQRISATKDQMTAETFSTAHASNLILFPTLNRLLRDPNQPPSDKKQERNDPKERDGECLVIDTGPEENHPSQKSQQTNNIIESVSDVEPSGPVPSGTTEEGEQNAQPEHSLNERHHPLPPQNDPFRQAVGTGDAAFGTTQEIRHGSRDNSQRDPFVANELDFDQRLLHDLIKDYGEFVAAPNLPAATEQHNARGQTKNQKSRSSEAPRSEESPSINNLPTHRREGELDRKLKKLIKDYGEYDLYSHQTPSKLRRGVLAAFLMLAVVFPAIYFLSGPKSIAPSSQSSAPDSQSGSDDVSTGPLLGTEIQDPSISKRRGAASPEMHHTTETNEPTAAKNKAALKKKNIKAGPPS